jgi:hypothetical protein
MNLLSNITKCLNLWAVNGKIVKVFERDQHWQRRCGADTFHLGSALCFVSFKQYNQTYVEISMFCISNHYYYRITVIWFMRMFVDIFPSPILT